MNTVIFFSKNRPMQCEAVLRSFYSHCTDKSNCNVVTFFSCDYDYLYAYSLLEIEFPSVKFIRDHDFYFGMLEVLDTYKSDFITFVVDDNLFIDDFSISEAQNVLLNNDNILSFSLRMGVNIEKCYTINKKQELPIMSKQDKFLIWNWHKGAEYDWNYPFDISSSVHRYENIRNIFDFTEDIRNPNYLEYFLDGYKSLYIGKQELMASYVQSVAFCNPINKVNPENYNRSGENEKYALENLLQLFYDGYRIDLKKFNDFVPTSPHQEVEVNFV